MIRRTLRRMRDDESGLSLAELLVSGLLTIGIMAMIGTMFIQTAKITSQSTQTTKSNNVASNIANSVTTTLRVATNLPVSGDIVPAPAVSFANKETVTLTTFSNVDAANPTPVQIRYYLDTDRNLKEERCTGVLTAGFYTFAPCASTTTRNLGGVVTPLVNSGDIPLFTYYNSLGPIVAAGDLSLPQRKSIVAIRVYVSVKAPGSETKKVVISNKVVLSNLGLEND